MFQNCCCRTGVFCFFYFLFFFYLDNMNHHLIEAELSLMLQYNSHSFPCENSKVKLKSIDGKMQNKAYSMRSQVVIFEEVSGECPCTSKEELVPVTSSPTFLPTFSWCSS